MDSVLSPLLLELQAFSEAGPHPWLLQGSCMQPSAAGDHGTQTSPPLSISECTAQGRRHTHPRDEGQSQEGGRAALSMAWPAARSYCSQMETVKPCQPQIHTESATSAFLECVAAPASPSTALDSITCQVPSASPELKPSHPLTASAHRHCGCLNI